MSFILRTVAAAEAELLRPRAVPVRLPRAPLFDLVDTARLFLPDADVDEEEADDDVFRLRCGPGSKFMPVEGTVSALTKPAGMARETGSR